MIAHFEDNRSVFLALAYAGACAAVACSDGEHPRHGDETPALVSRITSELVEQLVDQLDSSLLGQLQEAGRQDLAVNFALPGAKLMSHVYAHLAMPCTSASVSGPTCKSHLSGMFLLPMVDSCFVTGCTDSAETFVDVYWTEQLGTAPESRAPVQYQTDALSAEAEITYDPGPLTRWVYRRGESSSMTVSAEVSESVSVALRDNLALDLSYYGHLKGERRDTSETQLELTLPNLSLRGPIAIELQNSNAAPRRGSISIGDEALATIGSNGIEWLERIP